MHIMDMMLSGTFLVAGLILPNDLSGAILTVQLARASALPVFIATAWRNQNRKLSSNMAAYDNDLRYHRNPRRTQEGQGKGQMPYKKFKLSAMQLVLIHLAQGSYNEPKVHAIQSLFRETC